MNNKIAITLSGIGIALTITACSYTKNKTLTQAKAETEYQNYFEFKHEKDNDIEYYVQEEEQLLTRTQTNYITTNGANYTNTSRSYTVIVSDLNTDYITIKLYDFAYIMANYDIQQAQITYNIEPRLYDLKFNDAEFRDGKFTGLKADIIATCHVVHETHTLMATNSIFYNNNFEDYVIENPNNFRSYNLYQNINAFKTEFETGERYQVKDVRNELTYNKREQVYEDSNYTKLFIASYHEYYIDAGLYQLFEINHKLPNLEYADIEFTLNPSIIDGILTKKPLFDNYTTDTIAYQTIEFNLNNPSVTYSEIIDLPGMMLTILSMPWTFISKAFNVTIFEGTIYQINFSNIFKGLIAILTLLFIVRLFTNGFNAIGNIASSSENRKNTRADTQLKQSQTRLNDAKTKKVNSNKKNK